MTRLKIKISERQKLVRELLLPQRLLLGRQKQGEPGPYSEISDTGAIRLVIAPNDDTTVSRRQLLLEALGGDLVRVHNTGSAAMARRAGVRDPVDRG